MFSPDPTADGPPTLHIEGPLACLRLNRPLRRNRLDDGDLAAIVAAMAQLDQRVQQPGAGAGGPRVLLIASAGPAFCAGYDLPSLEADPVGGPQRFEAMVQAVLAQPLPTICRLHGGVYGGATDLALACDFRIGTHAVELRMPAARIGLHYSPRGLARFAARLGPSVARRLFLSAPTLDARELHRIGYLDELVGPPASASESEETARSALDAAVLALARDIAAFAPLAVQGMRRSLDGVASEPWPAQAVHRGAPAPSSAWNDALEREERCARSEDLLEGLAALRTRRTPEFRGR